MAGVTCSAGQLYAQVNSSTLQLSLTPPIYRFDKSTEATTSLTPGGLVVAAVLAVEVADKSAPVERRIAPCAGNWGIAHTYTNGRPGITQRTRTHSQTTNGKAKDCRTDRSRLSNSAQASAAPASRKTTIRAAAEGLKHSKGTRCSAAPCARNCIGVQRPYTVESYTFSTLASGRIMATGSRKKPGVQHRPEFGSFEGGVYPAVTIQQAPL